MPGGIETFAALWVSVMYFERVVFDNYLYRFGPGKRQSLRAFTPGAVLVVIAGLPLQAIAMALTPNGARQITAWLEGALRMMGGTVANPRSYLVAGGALLFFAILRATIRRDSLDKVGSALRTWVGRKRDDIARVLVAAVAVLALWALVYLFATSAGTVSLPGAIQAWLASGLFIAIHHMVAVVVFQVDVGRHLGNKPSLRALAWAGFMKDSSIYAIISLFVGSGLLKYRAALPTLPSSARWPVLGWFAIVAIVVAVFVLLIDVLFAERVLLEQHGWAKVWRQKWQRRAVHRHVYLRDFGIIVPGIVVMFGWLALEIARTPPRP